MDAVTYPDKSVVTFVNEHIVPVRVNISSEPLPEQFNVQWTPTLVLLDEDGKEHHRTVGWLSPEDLIASLLLGIGQAHIDRGDLSAAGPVLQRVVSEYPDSDAAPEALYLDGVVRYKQTDDIHVMNETLGQLRAKYPSSEWTKRASVYEAA